MIEIIKQIAVVLAPIVFDIIISAVTYKIAKKVIVKKLQSKIDEVHEADQLKKIGDDVSKIKKEIMEMRGKRK